MRFHVVEQDELQWKAAVPVLVWVQARAGIESDSDGSPVGDVILRGAAAPVEHAPLEPVCSRIAAWERAWLDDWLPVSQEQVSGPAPA